jgi:hypothetical protein
VVELRTCSAVERAYAGNLPARVARLGTARRHRSNGGSVYCRLYGAQETKGCRILAQLLSYRQRHQRCRLSFGFSDGRRPGTLFRNTAAEEAQEAGYGKVRASHDAMRGQNNVEERMTGTGNAEARAAGIPFFLDQISAFTAGAVVFAAVLATYFLILFARRGLVEYKLRFLFRVFPAGEGRTYGTRSRMQGIHSQFVAPGSSDWANYEYTGRMMLTDSRGGIGVMYLGRPNGREDRSYSLRRCGKGDTLYVSGGGKSAKWAGRSDSELSPEAGVWYRFRIQATTADPRTHIRAKVWKSRSPEPDEWQIDCSDAGTERNVRGSVGVWGCSEGRKYFDDLLVRPIAVQSEEDAMDVFTPLEEVARYSPARQQPDHLNDGSSELYLLREDFDGFDVGSRPPYWRNGCAAVDLSEATDSFSRLFGMNLLDFAGPWDEFVDLAAVMLTFGAAGLLAGVALKYRVRRRHSTASRGNKGSVPLECVPFILLFLYVGVGKHTLLMAYPLLGVPAGYLWRLSYCALARLFGFPTGPGVVRRRG